MKKIISVIVSITIIFSLASCKTENELSSSIESDITSSDLTTSNIETTSSDESEVSSDTENSQEPPTVSKDESVSSESSKITQSSKPTSNTSSESTPKPKLQNIDKNRAPSNDVASAFDGDYVYYQSAEYTVSFSTSLCRNKLDGSSEEVVIADYCPSYFKAKNGKLYFLRYGYIYKCNGDGSNLERINVIDKISYFEIAGDWIFAISVTNQDNDYKRIDELYMLKIDCSDLRRLQPNATNYKIICLSLYGFNRGYLYYEYKCYSSKNSIAKSYKYRIDYRSNNLQPEELDSKFEFSIGNEKIDSLYLDTEYISYDTIPYGHYYTSSYIPRGHYCLSLENNKGVLIIDDSSEYSFHKKLKDYFVYSIDNNYKNGYQIMFADKNGNKKEFIIPLPEGHSNDICWGISVCDPKSNYITVFFFDYKLKHRILYLISPEGIVSELYNKKF